MGEGLEWKDGGEKVQVENLQSTAEENEELEGEDNDEEELAEALEDIAEEIQELEGEDGDEEELDEALEEIEEKIEELEGKDGSATVVETLAPAATELSPPLLNGADAVPPSVSAAARIIVEPTELTKVHKGALLGCAVVAMAAFALVMYNIKGSK